MIGKRFQKDLAAIGITKADVLMVHSSFRSLGAINWDAEDVIQILLEYLGPEGTLLMPALSYDQVTPHSPYFHLLKTVSCVGIIPERFRHFEGVTRSMHPSHSVCAIGRYAREILENHLEDSTPCGEHSPFSLLPKYRGKILMLGCGLRPNTSMHAIEELHKPEYLFGKPTEYVLTDEKDQAIRKIYTPHNFWGWIQRYDRIAQLDGGGWITRGSVLQADSFVVDADLLWKKASRKMEKEKNFFVDRGYLALDTY